MDDSYDDSYSSIQRPASSSSVLHNILHNVMWDPFGLPTLTGTGSKAAASSDFPQDSPQDSRHLLADDDYNNIPDTPTNGGSSPSSLSPSLVEQELLALATNFLLYCALGIIMYFVCTVYFPWTVQPSRAEMSQSDGLPTSAADSSNSSSSARTGKASKKKSSSVSHHIFSDLSDDSDSDSPTSSSPFVVPPPSPRSFIPKSINHSPSPTSQTPTQVDSPQIVFKRLCLCTFGLITTFVTWGVLQERMLTRRYPRLTGEKFEYVYFLVFSNRLWSLCFSGFINFWWLRRKPWVEGVNLMEISYSAVSNLLSSWCQYEALKYVSFPCQTLFKSFKLLPVMVMGKLLRNSSYETYEYAVSVVVGLGLTLFLHSSEDVDFGSFGDRQTAGVVLLGLFLTFDSFTGQWQSLMFSKHRKNLAVTDMLFYSNLFSTVLSLITLVHEDELDKALEFVFEHQEIHLHFFLFSLCSTIGQLIIFYTIREFGAVVFAIIMTIRVLTSIVVSCIIYSHPITFTGALGLLFVMSGVGYRIGKKAQGGQLIKFQSLEMGTRTQVLQSWHENLDM
ncbi:hypothetical protein TrST_g12630 [Triparma strigata]|uniref:Uncharacterized protein n=1 Tax=Triparma strigata TaxID=1606541 RepID=A0A9W7BUB9_9STRA|nr:hypothetical protein TrST_g12630 [Triparma strigata]